MEALKLGNIRLLGVAKGTTRKAGLETLVIDTEGTTTRLPSDSPALHLIQHIRDEAHRFAITGHRRRRNKLSKHSLLQDIPGVGIKRRQNLLRYFGGLQGNRSGRSRRYDDGGRNQPKSSAENLRYISPRKMNIPNIPNTLTISRIILIPVFVILFYLPFSGHYMVACLVFTIATITDYLDGYLARKLKQISPLGAFLDPVADKLIVAIALVLLVQKNPSFWLVLPAIIIIGREITVSALREWMAELGERSKIAVSFVGKIKTAAQMISIILLIFREPIFGISIYGIGMVLLYIASILTLWSMLQYLAIAWPKLNKT